MLEKDLDAALRKFTDQGMRKMNKQILSVQCGKCNERIIYKAALSGHCSLGVRVWSESQMLIRKLHT